MGNVKDGPISPLFWSLSLQGNASLADLPSLGISDEMAQALEHAPQGECVGWGIPFAVGDVVALVDEPVTVQFGPTTARWFVLAHTSDRRPCEPGPDGFISPMRGEGRLGEHAADYVMLYESGAKARQGIRRRHEIGAFQRHWGENCLEAVAHHKPYPLCAESKQPRIGWGKAQTRATAGDDMLWINWLWAWENPHPTRAVVGMRFVPGPGIVVISAISAGDVSSLPLRWRTRRKAVLTLAEEEALKPELDSGDRHHPHRLLEQVQLDMGQVISATPRLIYPNEAWAETYNNALPERSEREVLVEYTAHPDARFHLLNGQTIPVAQVEEGRAGASLRPLAPATRRVKLRVVTRDGGQPVPVKLHVHGEEGEYLAPIDRHRIINPAWFEDYSVDFVHQGSHACTYIPGETTIDLPLGRVYVEVAKGYEIRPLRRVVEVTGDSDTIEIALDKVLRWREKGWVSADTHVHFLSPTSALLEGAGEGVNVVNLLASQWGELMTNVGDFDGRTTWGSKETGGGPFDADGEHLVRVGTENRQHVLGHISLLGYEGQIIAPMTTGGPDESALGDPIEVLLTEWARQCKRQNGLAILPHFPNPRAEHAATVVTGDADAVEMTSWGNLYDGIDPYSLSDWYRYLNCGYMVAAVGGTDKMSATTAVGTVRTYAHLAPGEPFTYEAWKDAVRRAETFVTYGPLLTFAVDGQPMGGRIEMAASGGTVDVVWEAASVTVPMSRVELVVNGEIRESVAVPPDRASGSWRVRANESSWLALLVRGHYADKPEIIAAHSSPVMISVAESPMLAAADAVTILEQIEGALAYLDTVGTRADDVAYKRMRLVLTSAHRALHNRMHQLGAYHDHTAVNDHGAHRS
jgi:hypothetical protein